MPKDVLSAADPYTHIMAALRKEKGTKRNVKKDGPPPIELADGGASIFVRLADAQVRRRRRRQASPPSRSSAVGAVPRGGLGLALVARGLWEEGGSRHGAEGRGVSPRLGVELVAPLF